MSLREPLAKLVALRGNLEGWLASKGLYFDPSWVLDLFERYAALRDRLRAELSEIFGDLPVRPIQKPSGTTDFEGRGYIRVEDLRLLMSDIDYCIDVLSNLPTVDIPSMKVTREGVFFAGEYFDALRQISEILGRAKQVIIIIDGYVNEAVLALISSKQKGVAVNILTKDVSAALRAAAIAFNKQYGGLSIRTSGAFHDRFVIIDDDEFYHFGASLKDAGHRGFMFSRIEEPGVIDAIGKKFAEEWAKAKVEV